jgi:hypothetical protein
MVGGHPRRRHSTPVRITPAEATCAIVRMAAQVVRLVSAMSSSGRTSTVPPPARLVFSV